LSGSLKILEGKRGETSTASIASDVTRSDLLLGKGEKLLVVEDIVSGLDSSSGGKSPA